MNKERFECFVDEWDEYNWYVKDNKNNEQLEYLEDVTKLLNQQDQRIAELEEQLKNLKGKYVSMINENVTAFDKLEEEFSNVIVPKFKVGQEVWWIDTRVNSFNEQRYRIESYLIDSIVITKEQFRYYGDDGLWLGDNELFATKEDALKKLEKLQGE